MQDSFSTRVPSLDTDNIVSLPVDSLDDPDYPQTLALRRYAVSDNKSQDYALLDRNADTDFGNIFLQDDLFSRIVDK